VPWPCTNMLLLADYCVINNIIGFYCVKYTVGQRTLLTGTKSLEALLPGIYLAFVKSYFLFSAQQAELVV